MKNIVLSLAVAALLAACSSGTTVAPLPSSVTSQFEGPFSNQNNSQRGTIRLDLVQDSAGAVSGNLIVNSTGFRCLANSPVTGTSDGFNTSLTSTLTRRRFQITSTERVEETDDNGNRIVRNVVTETFSDTGTEGRVVTINAAGNEVTTVTTSTEVMGNVSFVLAITNNGNTLSGTYVTDGTVCSNSTGTGDLTLTRI